MTSHRASAPARSPHRRRVTAIAMLLLVIATVAATMPLGAAAQSPPDSGSSGTAGDGGSSGTTRLIVELDTDAATATVASAADAVAGVLGGAAGPAEVLPRSHAMSVAVPSDDVAAARQRLASRPEVTGVERDAVVHTQATPPLATDVAAVAAARTPNDPAYDQQWALPHINAPQAWSRSTGSSAVQIAVLDTGVDAGHGDLAANVGRSYNAVGSGSASTDAYGHGTKAAGVAAAATDNGAGVAGVCWRCEIWPVKVLADDGSGLHSDVAEGVRWAADNGAEVIALSLGGHGRTTTLESAISDAVAAGAVVIASAGNYGTSEAVYPAAYDDAIGVAALDQSDQRTSYSSYGSWVSVGAPGCTITTQTGGGTTGFCGTSAAAPNVAGLAGLAAAHGASSPQAVRSAIVEGAHPTGQGMGAGRIDADATLQLAASSGGDGSDGSGSSDGGSGDGSGSDGSSDDGSSDDGSSDDGSGGDGSSDGGSGGSDSGGDSGSDSGGDSGGDSGSDDGSGDGSSGEGLTRRIVGADRYATAAELSSERIEPGVGQVYLATGQRYADALAAGAAAGARGAPVLLTAPDALPQVTADELARLAPGEVVVVGGERVVSDAVAAAAGQAADAPTTRVAGANRFATAAEIAGTADAQTAYLATGQGFADALAGVPAAVVEDAPMLLSGRDALPGATRDALGRLAPQRVVILGGQSALSSRVRQQVAAAVPGAAITRLAGDDRFATAARVAHEVFDGSAVEEVVVATGQRFPDALAAGPIAGASGAPLLLVTRDGMPQPTEDVLRQLGPSRSLLLGGLGAVGDGVAGLLDGLLR